VTGAIDNLIAQAGLLDPEIEPDTLIGGTSPLAKTAIQISDDLQSSMRDIEQAIERSRQTSKDLWAKALELPGYDAATVDPAGTEDERRASLALALDSLTQAVNILSPAREIEAASTPKKPAPEPEPADAGPGMGS
jgi:hypothetical protein